MHKAQWGTMVTKKPRPAGSKSSAGTADMTGKESTWQDGRDTVSQRKGPRGGGGGSGRL